MMLALVLAVSVSARPVDGQVPASAGEAEFVSAAKKHFKQRQYAEAITEFQAAYEAEKNTVRLYNIGKCYERLRETGKALRYFREYLRIEPTAVRDDVLTSEIANAERQLKEEREQQSVIHADPTGAQAFVDKVREQSTPASVLRQRQHRGTHALEPAVDQVRRADGDTPLRFRFGKRGVAKRDVAPDPTPPQPVAPEASSESLGTPLPREYTGDGWLTLRTEPWCDVYLSGEHLGTTPINRLVFPTGKYSLRLVNESARIHQTLKVEIRTGEESTTRLMLETEEPVALE